MLEFISVVAVIIAVIVLIDIKTSDEVHISFKLGDKEIIKYDKEDVEYGKEKSK